MATIQTALERLRNFVTDVKTIPEFGHVGWQEREGVLYVCTLLVRRDQDAHLQVSHKVVKWLKQHGDVEVEFRTLSQPRFTLQDLEQAGYHLIS